MTDPIEAVIARVLEHTPFVPGHRVFCECSRCTSGMRAAAVDLALALQEALGLMKAVHESSDFREKVVARVQVMEFLKRAGIIPPEPTEEKSP